MSFQAPLSLVQRELLELSKATESKIVVPAPNGRTYLPFQLAGIEYGVHPAVKNVLLGDEPGLGKTVQGIGICNHLKARKILVLTPAKLRGVWETHLQDWLAHDADVEVVNYTSLADPEKVKAIMRKGPFDVALGDEIHYLKNPQAKRTKYTLAKNGLISSINKFVAMSGTPIQNRPIELYPIAKTLAPASLGNLDKFGFGIKYCAGWKTPWGAWDFTGASNLKELGLRFRSTFMVRRTKDKVLKDLPEKFVNLVHVESKDGALALSKLEALDVETVIKGGGKSLSEDDHVSSVRERVGFSKVDFAAGYIKEQLDAGHQKIVVFAHHKRVISGLEQAFSAMGIDFETVRGGNTTAQVNASVEKFQRPGGPKIFLGSLMATKEGLTLTAASYVIFVEFSWAPMDNEQAMDRTHRIGQKNNVMVDFLVVKGTLDERIAKFCIEKSKAIKEFGE